MTNATHHSSGASVDLHVNQNLESNQLAQFGNVGVETRELEEEIRFLFFSLQTLMERARHQGSFATFVICNSSLENVK